MLIPLARESAQLALQRRSALQKEFDGEEEMLHCILVVDKWPAAAVIPAPIAYIKVVAVKKLVVGFLVWRA